MPSDSLFPISFMYKMNNCNPKGPYCSEICHFEIRQLYSSEPLSHQQFRMILSDEYQLMIDSISFRVNIKNNKFFAEY